MMTDNGIKERTPKIPPIMSMIRLMILPITCVFVCDEVTTSLPSKSAIVESKVIIPFTRGIYFTIGTLSNKSIIIRCICDLDESGIASITELIRYFSITSSSSL